MEQNTKILIGGIAGIGAIVVIGYVVYQYSLYDAHEKDCLSIDVNGHVGCSYGSRNYQFYNFLSDKIMGKPVP